MRRKLLLFDIDGTLIDTGGAGMAALREAAREFFGGGRELPELDLAGSTDSGIVRGMFEHFGEPHQREAEQRFYDVYLRYLGDHLPKFEGHLLHGVAELLGNLTEGGRCAVGLLTGNVAKGAAMKVGHYGIGRHFGFGAYGDDHHDRNELGPVALRRAAAATGEEFSPADAVVIGDTPKDIWCGEALGAKTVAVATGRYSADELRGFGADVVFDDFGEAGAVESALLG